ncbi:MAG: transporter, partial [Bacteroidota bacterium]
LGLTYLGQTDIISWGSQLNGIFRFGENERDFRFGNRYNLNNWIAIKPVDWLSFSVRMEGLIVDEIEGADPDLNPLMVITADTNNSGGNFINSGLGFNTYIPTGALKNLRFGFEFGFPIYQDLNGIQLKQKETLSFGAQYSFK